MKVSYAGTEELTRVLVDATRKHLESCSEFVLPFDTYCLMASSRGIDCINAYSALVDIDNFVGCAVIARAQLDSVARLHTVHMETDPHSLAQRLIEGKQLRDIKGAAGMRLTDGFIVSKLAELNPWVAPAYKQLNAAAHLSTLHYKSVLAQAIHKDGGVMTARHLGDSSYVLSKDKLSLNRVFESTTRGIAFIMEKWQTIRPGHPSTEDWLAKARRAT